MLLAPTVNLHRTPIGGRNFECMSEDPYLTARTAVAYVRGLQAEGVAACIKHFVGNDTEFERNIDRLADRRADARELYLVPFEAAVKEAGVWSVMTSYNRINGPWAADSVEMIHDVLRGEWGFDGLVVSDWFGLHSTAEGVTAGLDLEMPGPTLHRGQKLVDAVAEGKASAADVRRSARQVLASMLRLGAFDDGRPGPELTRDLPEDRASCAAPAPRAWSCCAMNPPTLRCSRCASVIFGALLSSGPTLRAARPRVVAAPTCPPPMSPIRSMRCRPGSVRQAST